MKAYFVIAAIWAAIVIIDSATGGNWVRDGGANGSQWEEYRGRR